MEFDYLVSGKTDFKYCSTARKFDDMCGKEGKKYVDKLDNKITCILNELKQKN